jgi:hypothetical protein
VDVAISGDVADVSDVHAASIFMVEVLVVNVTEFKDGLYIS